MIIALIPNNGSDKASEITNLHQKLLMDIVPWLNLHILSISSDGALVKFQTQTTIQSMVIDQRLQLIDTRFDVIFSYPLVGPILRVQDLKHAKKLVEM